jgi:hypothetical protein
MVVSLLDLAYIDANNTNTVPGTGTTITDLSGLGRTQNLISAARYTVLSGVKCWDCNNNYIYASAAVIICDRFYIYSVGKNESNSVQNTV